jgi:Icc-related predicted phosphoesterase
MRLQLFSDLHLDVMPVKAVRINPGVDVVIAAGDICEVAVCAFERLRQIVPASIPIVMVLGNHEYYRSFIPDELAQARVQAACFNIRFLENDSVEIGTVRFVGATLWTDYLIFGQAQQGRAMTACRAGMNDSRRIGWRKRPWARFRPQEAALLHHQSRRFIADVLATPFAGATVVVTHHAVHLNSVPAHLRGDLLTAAYVSDLSPLIAAHQPDLWLHGHVHHSADYRLGATRVVCNPHGYGHENPAFDPARILEVGT